jgi:AbrB family looped-hinge helix DNA binding protein
MARVQLRERSQITLPDELRTALDLKQGDYLDAEIVDGRLVLSPVTGLDREAARERLRSMLSGPSRWHGPGPAPDDDAVMDEVLIDIEEGRRERLAGGR